MFKEVLIGVSAAVLATALIVAVLPSTSTDTTTSPAPTATEAPVAVEPTVAPEPVAVTSLAGCSVTDDIRCEVYHRLFPLISAEYFPDESVEFTDADFNWVDCMATVASEHLFPDSSQEIVEQALQDGLNACGQ